MRFGLKNERVKYSFPLRYLNRGPLELKASVLTMSYADTPRFIKLCKLKILTTGIDPKAFATVR